jgi:predicted RecA/RadA family phage recombinase
MAAPNVKNGITEYVKPGDVLTLTAGGTISAGNLVRISGNRTIVACDATHAPVGVALHDAASGDAVSVATEGVWPVKAAGAVAAGDMLVAAAAGAAAPDNTTPDAMFLVGMALEAIADTAVGRVKLRL